MSTPSQKSPRQRMLLVAMVIVAVATVMLAISAPWWYAATLAVLFVILLFLYTRKDTSDAATLAELRQYKHIRVDAREVKEYREQHPGTTLAQATLAVKKRHA